MKWFAAGALTLLLAACSSTPYDNDPLLQPPQLVEPESKK